MPIAAFRSSRSEPRLAANRNHEETDVTDWACYLSAICAGGGSAQEVEEEGCAGSRRRRVALRYKQLSEVKRGRSAWHTTERVTPYGARLIITQICSSFTGRQHTSRAFACPRRYTCNTCRACPFSCTRSFALSLLAFSLSLFLFLSPHLFLSQVRIPIDTISPI